MTLFSPYLFEIEKPLFPLDLSIFLDLIQCEKVLEIVS